MNITIGNPPPIIVTTNPQPDVQVTATVIGPPGPVGEGGASLGANEFTGPQNLNDNQLEEAKTVTFYQEYDNGTSGIGNINIIWANSQFQKLTITGNCTITIGNPIGVCHNQLRLIQDSIGGHSVTFVGLNNNRWIGTATIPPINNNALGETVINMFFDGVQILQSMCRVGTP